MNVRQFLCLPRTLLKIHRAIREDCSPSAADEYLRAFRGFHLEPDQPNYRARLWQPVTLSQIRAADVVDFTTGEMAMMMHVAMEIEDPIVDYSHQNGEGFRFLLPGLARFMGRNQDEADYARAHGLKWCESAWCAEERRHGAAFAKAIERLTGESPARDNPNQPKAMTSDEDLALQHLVSREAAEWSSSATYTAMAAHSTGMLHTLLRNLARDEIKHLCILSAADAYLRGPRPWRRFGQLLRIGAGNYRGQQQRRSHGQRMGANAITRIEVVVAHLLMEWRIRRWIARVPLAMLRTVFETDSPPIDAGSRTPAEQARIDARLAANREDRLRLARWSPAARRNRL
ncbi:MAG: hypothetical protein EPO35_07080 [Acidobacteria bacterium]|nr:MAG: hypothetical protein EPO35_07080 [Acidobacteriota bacterium]